MYIVECICTYLVRYFPICLIFWQLYMIHEVFPFLRRSGLRICKENKTQQLNQLMKSYKRRKLIYRSSLISLLLNTTFLDDCDNLIFRSVTSVPTFRCFLRVFTSAGRIIINICSVLNSENNCRYCGLIALREKIENNYNSQRIHLNSSTYLANVPYKRSLINTSTSPAAYSNISFVNGRLAQYF